MSLMSSDLAGCFAFFCLVFFFPMALGSELGSFKVISSNNIDPRMIGGSGSLQTVDCFYHLIEHDATPLALNLDAVCEVDEEELNAYHQVTDEEKEEDDVWESEGEEKASRNAFDMFGGFDDEPDL